MVSVRAFSVRRLLRRLAKILLSLILISVLPVIGLWFVDPPIWSWQIHRALFKPSGYPSDSRHVWVSLSQIAKPMQLAVIAAEDQRFPEHIGFDFAAIKAAFIHNQHHQRMKGGSTISQQTAKNLFLWPSRSYVRKGFEAWYTLLMEAMLGKERILELYLNVVEFGPGIYGVEAASHYYYGKSARYLNWKEAARLAAVLPNPYRYRVSPPSPYVRERSQWIAQQMGQLGYVTLNRL